MKTGIFLKLCFIFLVENAAIAQYGSVDSLNSLLQQHQQQDTARVRLLNKLSGELRGSDIVKSRQIAEDAYSLAKTINDTRGQAYALRNIGISYLVKGDFANANDYLQKGLPIAKQSGDPSIIILTLTNLGLVQNNLSQYPKAINYLEQALDMARKTKDSTNLSLVFANLGQVSYFQGSYPKALDYTLQSLKISERLVDKQATAQALTGVGNIYSEAGDQEQALSYLQRALKANEELGSQRDISIVLNGLGNIYRKQGKYEKAIDEYQKAIKIKRELKSDYGVALNESRLADIYLRQGKAPLALEYAYKSLDAIDAAGDKENVGFIYNVIARSSLNENKIDSAIYRATQSLQISRETGSNSGVADASEVLADAYAKKKDFSNAYYYQQLFTAYRDSVASDSVSRRVNLLLYNYNLDKKQAEISLLTKDKELQAEANKKQRDFLIGTLIGLGLLCIMAIALLRSNRQKQKANKQLVQQKTEIASQADLLREQNIEISAQKNNLEKAIDELKSTQSLLIQKEKMASLGELTAGIAHEIQNPLNFVNNFSDLNTELITEMKNELSAGNIEEVLAIAKSIEENGSKIAHHGKRADAIVKGMLQHSRSSSGQKELTDINKLADEYLRLSYHGLRAKDQSFNATMQTDFDPGLSADASGNGEIYIVSQEIGRVLLNLFNNAFYAVRERKKAEGADYKPMIVVSTKKLAGCVEIRVEDNGSGIPPKVLDKIYQPFFTTKPTGEGTGLGLSLSYEIIKSHGGELKVESKEGYGAVFIIQLPSS
ncbi:MAG: tetratricopeptide repeat protein [Ginsengibacter sp.]